MRWYNDFMGNTNFDYLLARKADNDKSTETTTLDELLQDMGISYEELQQGRCV